MCVLVLGAWTLNVLFHPPTLSFPLDRGREAAEDFFFGGEKEHGHLHSVGRWAVEVWRFFLLQLLNQHFLWSRINFCLLSKNFNKMFFQNWGVLMPNFCDENFRCKDTLVVKTGYCNQLLAQTAIPVTQAAGSYTFLTRHDGLVRLYLLFNQTRQRSLSH